MILFDFSGDSPILFLCVSFYSVVGLIKKNLGEIAQIWEKFIIFAYQAKKQHYSFFFIHVQIHSYQ